MFEDGMWEHVQRKELSTKTCDEHIHVFVRGEVGKGGRPRFKPNPYLDINMLNFAEPIIF